MKLEKIKKEIEEYQVKYRNPKLANFEISPIYDLFPDSETKEDFLKWPDSYAHGGRYGIYIILDDQFEVIYIGSSTNIGRRLSSYFMYSEDRGCHIKHSGWKGKPRYIFSVAVDDNLWFERLALEEYLICKASPSDNIRSKY